MSRHLGPVATSVFHSSTRTLLVSNRLSQALGPLKERFTSKNRYGDTAAAANAAAAAEDCPIFTSDSLLAASRKSSPTTPHIDIQTSNNITKMDTFSHAKVSPINLNDRAPSVVEILSSSSHPNQIETVYVPNPRIVRLSVETRRARGGQNSKKARFRAHTRSRCLSTNTSKQVSHKNPLLSSSNQNNNDENTLGKSSFLKLFLEF